MSKDKFMQTVFARRTRFIKEWCKKRELLKTKRQRLEEKYESADEKSKERIREEIARIDENIQKIKDELQGETVKKCFDQIEGMPNISKITYYPDKMLILTENIHINGKNWGKYVIQIGNSVRIKRNDGYEYEYNSHPFVRRNIPCYGIWNPTISKALTYGGYYTVVVATLKLLRCTKSNKSGWYISPSDFEYFLETKGVI